MKSLTKKLLRLFRFWVFSSDSQYWFPDQIRGSDSIFWAWTVEVFIVLVALALRCGCTAFPMFTHEPHEHVFLRWIFAGMLGEQHGADTPHMADWYSHIGYTWWSKAWSSFCAHAATCALMGTWDFSSTPAHSPFLAFSFQTLVVLVPMASRCSCSLSNPTPSHPCPVVLRMCSAGRVIVRLARRGCARQCFTLLLSLAQVADLW